MIIASTMPHALEALLMLPFGFGVPSNGAFLTGPADGVSPAEAGPALVLGEVLSLGVVTSDGVLEGAEELSGL